jgi:hypothetical protein
LENEFNHRLEKLYDLGDTKIELKDLSLQKFMWIGYFLTQTQRAGMIEERDVEITEETMQEIEALNGGVLKQKDLEKLGFIRNSDEPEHGILELYHKRIRPI